MSATLVVFPCREASRRGSGRLESSGTILPFPSRNGLAAADLAALQELMARLGGAWVCETERDGNGDRWAVISPRDPEQQGHCAYLICRRAGKLVLVDAPLSAGWRTHGIYDRPEWLVAALSVVLGCNPVEV